VVGGGGAIAAAGAAAGVPFTDGAGAVDGVSLSAVNASLSLFVAVAMGEGCGCAEDWVGKRVVGVGVRGDGGGREGDERVISWASKSIPRSKAPIFEERLRAWAPPRVAR